MLPALPDSGAPKPIDLMGTGAFALTSSLRLCASHTQSQESSPPEAKTADEGPRPAEPGGALAVAHSGP